MKKFLLYNILPLTSILCFLNGLIVLKWWGSSYNTWQLREQLKIISPLFLVIIFFLIIFACIINARNFVKVFKPIPQKTWILLGSIVIIGLIINVAVVPRVHRIFYDEDIYENIAQNIAYLKKAGMCNDGMNDHGIYQCYSLEYNKQPNAWPYLLSVVFQIAGVHERAAFLTNNMMYALSIITAFLIAYLLFGDYLSGIYAALIFSLIPEGLMWSNSVTVEPSFVLFSGLTILSILIFLTTRETKSLFLTVALLALTIQFRTESILLVPLVALMMCLFGRDELKHSRLYFLLSIFFILIIPHLIHLYAVRGEDWGATGPKLSSQYFAENFKSNTLYYLNNLRFPIIFTLFFIVGIFLHRGGFKEKNKELPSESSHAFFKKFHCLLNSKLHDWQQKFFTLIWFIVFWGIFIFFYAGGYNFGVDVRYSLPSNMPFAIMAGYGLGSLQYNLGNKLRLPYINFVLCLLILFSFYPFLPFVRALGLEAWAARADHRFAMEMAEILPDDSLVLTHNPNMFLLWGKNAAQASLATNSFKDFSRRYPGGIYFHYGFWCNVDDPLQQSFCKNILGKFDCTLIVAFKEQNYKFELYKINKVN